jgi:hypothetical protein
LDIGIEVEVDIVELCNRVANRFAIDLKLRFDRGELSIILYQLACELVRVRKGML